MGKLQHDLGIRLVKVFNILLMLLPFMGCWFFYYKNQASILDYRFGNLMILFLFVFLYVVFARVYDAFLVSLTRISEMIYSQALAILFSDTILFFIIWLIHQSFPNPLPMLLALCLQLLFATAWSVLVHKGYYAVFPPKKSIIVYGYRSEMETLIHEYGLEKKFDIKKSISIEQCVYDLSVLDDMEAIFISGVQSHHRNTILKYCIEREVSVYVLPRIGDIIMSGAQKMHMFHLPMLRVERQRLHPEFLLTKRLFDIVASTLVLLVTSPVMLATAIAIKMDDGGPVLYRQKRLTKDGRVFEVLKFRSMRVDAEKDGVARLSTGDNDDRITPVGKIIRKLRIDEIPQLFNILGGSMSVVGPRPERPEIAQQYEQELPEFRLRLQVKAGLTGYAQVYGKYNTTPYDKLQMDLMYIANPSLLEDLRIMFATVKILFMSESTDGIKEGQTTAIDVLDEYTEDLVASTIDE